MLRPNTMDHAASTTTVPCTRPSVDRVLKLGGAAITQKDILETPRTEVIAAAARHVAQAIKAQPGSRCVVVHGAGSYGHHQAVQYGVVHGWRQTHASEASVRKGFALTRASVSKLNGIVVDALLNEGLPAIGLSPLGSGWLTSDRRVVKDGCETIQDCLNAGLLPVLHGDCILDDQLGCTILSGDTIMRRIAEVMGARSVVFLTNVPGVYDRPPEQPQATLLRSIAVRKDGSWQLKDGVQLLASALDATGGIATKVEEAAVVAALGVDVVIAQAGTEDGRLACLLPASELEKLSYMDGGSGGWRGTLVRLQA